MALCTLCMFYSNSSVHRNKGTLPADFGVRSFPLSQHQHLSCQSQQELIFKMCCRRLIDPAGMLGEVTAGLSRFDYRYPTACLAVRAVALRIRGVLICSAQARMKIPHDVV